MKNSVFSVQTNPSITIKNFSLGELVKISDDLMKLQSRIHCEMARRIPVADSVRYRLKSLLR